jgi:hypothetical protein
MLPGTSPEGSLIVQLISSRDQNQKKMNQSTYTILVKFIHNLVLDTGPYIGGNVHGQFATFAGAFTVYTQSALSH